MGVLATFCQICGLPVQQDHYVPADGGGFFHIWRGDGDDACDPLVAFGPEHAWLRRAVGLRLDAASSEPPVPGLVHDGYIEVDGNAFGVDVMDGIEDRAAVHAACWGLAGRPDAWEPLAALEPPKAQEPYRLQLFDFEAFVADGHGWMLVDPDADSADGFRNRQRIAGILAAG